MKSLQLSRQRGISMVELLATVVVIALIVSAGFILVGKVAENSKFTKLEVDVASINTSINVYLASGGNLDGLTEPQTIIDKLKTARALPNAERYAGLRSSMIDKRLAAVMQTAAEAATSTPRAIWNDAKDRFEVADTGSNGVKHFILDDAMAAVFYGTEERADSAIDVNPDDGWVWIGGADASPLDGPQATVVPLGAGSTSSDSSGTDSGDGSDGSSGSDGSGDDGSDDDGDDGGSGSGTDGGDDGGPPPPERLNRPQIYPTQTKHPADSFPLPITITDFNPPAVSELQYSVDGGPWMVYSGGFTVNSGQNVKAKAVALDTVNYIDSYTRSRTYKELVSNFAGSPTPTWENVQGGQNLEYEVTSPAPNKADLVHGDTTIIINGEEQEAGTANSLKFTAETFSTPPSQLAALGQLHFFNGSTFNQSDAESATLKLVLDFTDPTTYQETVNVPMTLTSTPNSNDPYESADSVSLGQQWFWLSQPINGVNYYLYLEFGPAQSGGYGTNTALHAFEGAEAEVEVRGKFVPQ